MNRFSLTALILSLLLLVSCSESGGSGTQSGPYTLGLTRDTSLTAPSDGRIADHNAVHEIRNGRLSLAALQAAKGELHIAYGHTSHGSQIIDGMNGLVAFADEGNCDGTYQYSSVPGLFGWNQEGSGGELHLLEGGGYSDQPMDHDAGYFVSDSEWNDPDSENYHQCNWYLETRQFLDDSENDDYNVVIWSWCGQLSWYSAEAVRNNYLTPMDTLRADYPDITFVYMTGHLDGSGLTGNLHANNEIIREHCRDNNLWLFDFADIESYDPDGYYIMELGANDGCFWDSNEDGVIDEDDRNWAREWQADHTPDTEWYACGAAHSESIISNMKGMAIWWLWSRIAAERSP